MSNLSSSLTGVNREAVVNDLADFADQTVSEQSGISGMAVKTAYAGVQKVSPDTIHKGINRVLPDLAEALQPHWDDYVAAGGGQSDTAGTFGTFLDNRRDEVASSILEIADRTADRLDNPNLVKIYRSMRGRGEKLVAPNVAGIGAVVEKHVGA